MTQYEDPRESGVRIILVSENDISGAPEVGATVEAITEDQNINFTYDQPNVSVDTSARYVDHEVIGGMTVRQRIGEDPRQIGVSGLCTRQEARQIDQLYQTDFVEFESYRTGRITAQVTSASTDVHSDGGSVAKPSENGEMEIIYTFDISLVEI